MHFCRALHQLPPTIGQVLAAVPSGVTTVAGTVRSVRQLKNVAFVALADGLGPKTLTVVGEPAVVAGANLRVGAAVQATGEFVTAKGRAPELRVASLAALAVVGNVPEDFPLQKKFATPAFLRLLPTLRLRTNKQALVLRLRLRAELALGAFFDANGFTKCHAPVVTLADCEGAGETFTVEAGGKEPFFGHKAFLTVSTQLHLEALAAALNRVWTLAPCFRAEQLHTTRHLAEFWMVEAEVQGVTEVGQLTGLVEGSIRAVVAAMQTAGAGGSEDLTASRFDKEEQATMAQRWALLAAPGDWPLITYTKAVSMLERRHATTPFQHAPRWGDDLATEHERWLAGTYAGPVFVTHYPKALKPFYMLVSNPEAPAAEQTAACFDLLVPEMGELVGGSLREHDAGRLREAVAAAGMDAAAVEWYVQLRSQASVPHGGYGMGFERLVSYLGAVENVREAVAFPRAPAECAC